MPTEVGEPGRGAFHGSLRFAQPSQWRSVGVKLPRVALQVSPPPAKSYIKASFYMPHHVPAISAGAASGSAHKATRDALTINIGGTAGFNAHSPTLSHRLARYQVGGTAR